MKAGPAHSSGVGTTKGLLENSVIRVVKDIPKGGVGRVQSSDLIGDGAFRYTRYCVLRVQGVPEDRIKTEFEVGSIEAVYRTLIQDGHPVCPVCGKTPAYADHCEKGIRRQARGETRPSTLELPPARQAIPLFEKVIGRPDAPFGGGLHGYCKDLRHLEEKFHGKRFASNLVFENEAGFEGILRRADYSDEDWSALCEGFSQDPRVTDEITPYDVPSGPGLSVLGTQRTPAEQLVVLIAAYALMRNNLDPLVDNLHPDPPLLNRQQLESVGKDLRLAAEQMATLVRGGKVGRGAPVEGLPWREAFLAYRITDLKREGLSYEKIHEYLDEHGHEFSHEEVERLGGFGLQFPDF